jgi:aconitase A
MVRGTFANIRLRNQLAPGTTGGMTRRFPEGVETTIYEAALDYWREGVPLVIVGGREYGSGSSRDWAAKGTLLLGVRPCSRSRSSASTVRIWSAWASFRFSFPSAPRRSG